MKNLTLQLLVSIVWLSSCKNDTQTQELANEQDSIQTATVVDDTNATTTESTSDVTNIFPDFPSMGTTAQPHEHLLVPGYKMMENYVNGKAKNLIFYSAKMAKPADKNSTVAFQFDGDQEVPNYMIIPIPSGQKVKKGDIVLTWWQSGSGMQRALVTNDTDPSAPEVHYLDIKWDNPAKNNGVPIGQLKEIIKENTFVKLTDVWQSGTTIAAREGTSLKKFTVINVNQDKVLALGFAGIMKILNKADCTPLPVATQVKVGDKVQAPWVGSFKTCIVKELKPEFGRAVVEFDDHKGDLHTLPLGDITTGLVL